MTGSYDVYDKPFMLVSFCLLTNNAARIDYVKNMLWPSNQKSHNIPGKTVLVLHVLEQ